MLDQNFIAILVVFGLTLIGVTLVESAALTHQLYESGKAAEEAYFEKVAKYWTPERLRSTRTLKPPQMPLEKRTSNLSIHIEKQMNTNEFKNDRFEYDDVLEGDLSFDSDETQRATRLTNYVTKTVGILFVSSDFGYEMSCVASVVTSPSKSLVVTAASCLYNGLTRRWLSNFLFIPAAYDGYQPYGNWTGKKAVIPATYPTETGSNRSIEMNYGFLVVARPDKKLIMDVVGGHGISFTSSHSQVTVAFGFSSYLSMCAGYIGEAICGGLFDQFTTRRIICGTVSRSVGGPWMENFNLSTGIGVMIGLQVDACSYSFSFMVGPLFDAKTKIIYDSIKSST